MKDEGAKRQAMTMSPPQAERGAISDAGTRNWVDRFAPAALLPYLRLGRADRPIGFFLLALPCFWSVALAGRTLGEAYPDPRLLVLFAVGALVMRAAGCTYNDLVDRNIDAQVERTRQRPLPSGQVSVRNAILFMLALGLAGLVVLLNFNRFTIWLGLGVLPIVALYPFVKRFSYWPQAVLGLAFNWGALLGWTAALDRLDWPAIAVYAGAVAWTIGYDTIYAHQDREEDGVLGLKSTALRFGRASRAWVAALYGFAWLAITAGGVMAHAGTAFLLAMIVPGAQLAWQVATLNIDDPENCLERFRSNRDFAALVFAAIFIDMVLAAIF
jgi:4-hydroxybenzoate polyprenyltransferase